MNHKHFYNAEILNNPVRCFCCNNIKSKIRICECNVIICNDCYEKGGVR